MPRSQLTSYSRMPVGPLTLAAPAVWSSVLAPLRSLGLVQRSNTSGVAFNGLSLQLREDWCLPTCDTLSLSWRELIALAIPPSPSVKGAKARRFWPADAVQNNPRGRTDSSKYEDTRCVSERALWNKSSV